MPFSSESDPALSKNTKSALTYYEVLGVSPHSTQSQIRDAYRRKSKQYHPDTTSIEKSIAAQKFQVVNHAYDTLRFPEKRQAYDLKLRRMQVSMKSPAQPKQTVMKVRTTSAFLDPEDRPLSAGEVFALFILGVTFFFCLLVALFLGISRGEMLVDAMPSESSLIHQLSSLKPHEESQKSYAAPKNDTINFKHPSNKINHDANSKRMLNQKTGNTKQDSSPKQQLSLFPTASSH